MIDRRQLLAAASAAGLSAAAERTLSRAAFAQALPEVDLTTPIIDLHCHIFNAADLPIFGFMKSAVFEVFDEQSQVGRTAQSSCRQEGVTFPLTRGGLIGFAAFLDGTVSAGAIGAGNEASQLANGVVPASPGVTPLASDLQSFFGPPSGLVAAGGPTRTQRLMERELTPNERTAAREELRRQIARDSGRDPGLQSAGAAEALETVGQDTFTGRHINWVKRMASSRSKHAEEIAKLYSAKVRLFTPALIDYSKWLGDEPGSDLKNQILAMEQIALRKARGAEARFHGFIAFDPLRDVHERGAALALVKQAVGQRGFIGAKLYPPMGFKPLANASDPALTFPKHALTPGDGRVFSAAALAFELDRQLADFYAWCVREDVPILAHAANSRGAGPCYSERADPANWAPALARFPKLRVCLAHIGSFDVARDGQGRLDPDNTAKLQQSWEWRFARLVSQSAPNLYADLSYFHEVLTSGANEKAALQSAFVKLLRAFPSLSERLIYGSDWIMLDREAKREEHMKAVYWFMNDVLTEAAGPGGGGGVKATLRKIFSTNAVRFLGLDAGGAGRRRLDAFYRRHALVNAIRLFDEF